MPRYNLQIKVGTYTGNGVDNTSITGVGFRPQLVITKGGANIACFRTRHMSADSCAYFAGNTANFAGGIKGILDDGFQVGTDAKANANGTVYYYIAIRGTDAQQYFRTVVYKGNGSDSRQLTAAGVFFQPNIFWTKGDTAQNPSVRTEAVVGDDSWHFSGTVNGSNEIQNFVASGVELGTSARVNSSAVDYFATALRHFSGYITSGTYVGNGTSLSVTGLGFQPDFVIVKDGATTSNAVFKTSEMSGLDSAPTGSSTLTTTAITAFGADGFSLGNSVFANASGDTFYYFAFKAGNFNVPIARTAV